MKYGSEEINAAQKGNKRFKYEGEGKSYGEIKEFNLRNSSSTWQDSRI